jgi:restriction system protein
VAEQYRRLGYQVRLTAVTGDHGIDLICTRQNERIVVQCKRYSGRSAVPESVIRDLYGTLMRDGASRAALVSTGRCTPKARQWAHGLPLELWDETNLNQFAARAAASVYGDKR